MMHTPYSRAMLFLTYIKGDRVEDWISIMTRDLNHQARHGVSINDEILWNRLFKSFRRQYADMQERERVEDILNQGICMLGRKLDDYIAYYEQLTALAGYDPDNRLCLKYFTDGLPSQLYHEVLSLDRPRNYEDWKAAAIERQGIFEHCDNHKQQQRNMGKPHPAMYNPFSSLAPRIIPSCRDPDAMDTSANCGRV